MTGPRHRAAPDRREERARRRFSAAAAAVVAAVLLLLVSQGTLAYWTDRATVTGGQFSSGRLDLTVDGNQGTPSYARAGLSLAGMLPGESVAETLVVRNVGDAPFTWTATATTGGDLGPALAVEMFLGSVTTGDDTTYPRTEGCATTSAPVGSGSTATRLAPGAPGAAGQQLCMKVTLPAGVGNGFQNRTTGSVSIRLDATQAAS